MQQVDIPGLSRCPTMLCLGTASYGSAISRHHSFQLLDSFVEHGGNFLDTAHVYASWRPGGGGASETTIGEWMGSCGNRGEMVIGTKGCTLDKKTGGLPRFEPRQVARELDESLSRLGSNYIDIYWLHRDNPGIPVADILGLFADWLSTGIIRALAVSNWTAFRIREAIACARATGLPEICASQIGWSLAYTTGQLAGDKTMLYMDEETYDFHVESQFPQIAYSSQANGFFAGKGVSLLSQSNTGDEDLEGHRKQYGTEGNYARLKRATELARRRDTTARHIALSYILNHAFPTVAIVGPRTVSQVRDSCLAPAISLSPEEVAALRGSWS